MLFVILDGTGYSDPYCFSVLPNKDIGIFIGKGVYLVLECVYICEVTPTPIVFLSVVGRQTESGSFFVVGQSLLREVDTYFLNE